MDPAFLGRIQCFNVDQQCVLGEENTNQLMKNNRLQKAFEEGCGSVLGRQVRCCPLSLINQPYNPPQDGSVIPIHVKQTRNGYSVCPGYIRAGCARVKAEDIGLCVAQKCNDAGYLEADNYYQICKSYKKNGEMEEVPDCSSQNCEKMMKIPDWYLEGREKEIVKDPEEETGKGFSIQAFFDRLPNYNWTAFVLSLITLFLIFLNVFFLNIV